MMLEPYQTLLRSIIEAATHDNDVVGVFLMGSLARGDALPGTDLDLLLILAAGRRRPFRREVRDGVLVECDYLDVPSARLDLDTHPMRVYGYLDGTVLHDPHGELELLKRHARCRLAEYVAPVEQRARIAFLLRCSRDKMRVAMNGRDLLKAAYVTGTSSWQIMEGLWAANGLPVPPNSSVRPHLRDLTQGPPDVETCYRDLFLGDARGRVQTALELIDWILAQLDGSDW
jgi:hypothetical protein